MQKVKNPRILSLYDQYKDQNNIYLFTQFCNGGTLEDHLERYKKQKHQPLPENEA